MNPVEKKRKEKKQQLSSANKPKDMQTCQDNKKNLIKKI